MRQLLKIFTGLFEKLWFKFLVEIFITGFLFVVYYVMRYLLPQKYRVKDKTIRGFYRKFATMLTNMPNKDDNLFGIINKSRGIFSEFHEVKMSEDINLYMDEFAKQHDLDLVFDSLFLDNIFPHLETMAKHKIVDEIALNKALHEYDFGDNQKVYLAKQDAYVSIFKESNASYYMAVSKGFKPRTLIKKLLELHNNRLYICYSNDKLIFQKLDHDQNEIDYIPNNSLFDQLDKEIQVFKKRDIQRSYILYGPPGTGKTTFCLEISKKISNNIVKIDSNVFVKLNEGIAKMIFENIECSVIIVDDIDRIKNDLDVAALLYSLESVKNFSTKPTLIATVNNIRALDKAIIRPGRFDDIIHFDNPNKEEREHFIKTLLEKYNTPISQEDLGKFVEATEHVSQSYIKEFCHQFRNDNDIEIVMRKIADRKKFLKIEE
jgi:hypothetical protein